MIDAAIPDPRPPVGSWWRDLGTTGIRVPAICLGAAPLGGMPDKYGDDIGDEAAVALVRSAFRSPFRFIDTSNGYSEGRSERRIGLAVRAEGGLPDGCLIATKTDARDGDYSGERVRASVAESLERLGVDHLPLLYLHDPEFHDEGVLTAPGGAVDALVALRSEGLVDRIGLAGGDVNVMRRFLDLGVFDVFLTHNRWTLVDGSAGELIGSCAERGIAVVNAAVFGGGILGRPGSRERYGYRPLRPQVAAAIAAMDVACRRFGVSLATAALQFSLRDSRVHSTVVGVSRENRLPELAGQASATVPDELWQELESLRPDPRYWLDPVGALQ
jgi:D-threo-aldose 1-dehydrogenase